MEKDMETIVGKCEDRLRTKLETVGFDPTIIITIISVLLPIILDLIKNCQKRQNAAGLREQLRFPRLARLRVAMAIRRDRSEVVANNAGKLADCVCECAIEMDDKELQKVCDCASFC